MDFNLTEQQKMFKKVAKDFAENEIEPIVEEIDETREFPMETIKELGEMGMLGIPYPQKYGGAGADTLSYILVVEEISRVCSVHGVVLSVHTSLGCNPIFEHGTEEQKKNYLTPLLKGEKLGAFAMTEPNAGSDASSIETTATLDGDEYVLNGNKIFITNSGVADYFIIHAMTDKSKGIKGLSSFIVEADRPGFTRGNKLEKMGLHASDTRELIFQDCRIPKENLLGKEGEGFRIAIKSGINGGRIGIAAQALGIAQRALDESIQYVKERKQFGRPISKFQGLQWMIAEMDTEIQAARNLVYKAAKLKDEGKDFEKAAAQAKLHASNTAMDVTTKAVQLHGGYGYMKDYPVERLMRDAKITQIYEGTTEVQKIVIARSLLS